MTVPMLINFRKSEIRAVLTAIDEKKIKVRTDLPGAAQASLGGF